MRATPRWIHFQVMISCDIGETEWRHGEPAPHGMSAFDQHPGMGEHLAELSLRHNLHIVIHHMFTRTYSVISMKSFNLHRIQYCG